MPKRSCDGSDDRNYPLLQYTRNPLWQHDEQHRHSPRLQRQVPHPFLEIHPTTAATVGVADEEWVILETAISLS
jgi:anaerobic selenocysteine-containing dehydrogenase